MTPAAPGPEPAAVVVDPPPPPTIVWVRRLVLAQIVLAGLAIVVAFVLAAVGSHQDDVVGGLSVFLAVGFTMVAVLFVVALAVPLVLLRDSGPRPRTRRLLWLTIAQVAVAVPAFLFGVTLLLTASVGAVLPLVEVVAAAVVVRLATRPPSLEWARTG